LTTLVTTPPVKKLTFDVLIVDSGLAGLTAALQLAPTHRVAILTKRAMNDSSSGWAQGGIAAVMAEGDTFKSHVDDTLVAGAVFLTRPRPGLWSNTRHKPLPGYRPWACRFLRKTASCTLPAKAATARGALCM